MAVRYRLKDLINVKGLACGHRNRDTHKTTIYCLNGNSVQALSTSIAVVVIATQKGNQVHFRLSPHDHDIWGSPTQICEAPILPLAGDLVRSRRGMRTTPFSLTSSRDIPPRRHREKAPLCKTGQRSHGPLKGFALSLIHCNIPRPANPAPAPPLLYSSSSPFPASGPASHISRVMCAWHHRIEDHQGYPVVRCELFNGVDAVCRLNHGLRDTCGRPF